MTAADAPETSEKPSGKAWGKSMRQAVPRSSHGVWAPAADRPDPVDVITGQDTHRLQWLVPIRHWRMAQSPFAFYRGGAKVMALDLSTTPSTGLYAQLCGDAHLSNFGAYGSPERDLVFDVNDFDETLPGPWEWDLKRLAASFAIAARHNEFDPADEVALALAATAAYRKAMAQFAAARYLDAWYAHLNVEDVFAAFEDQLTKKQRKRSQKFVSKAKGKDSLHAAKKLAERVDGRYQIVAQPPLIVPLRDIPTNAEPEEIRATITQSFESYLDSVPDHLEVLLHRFSFHDLAIKVVGVGSVGTRCVIVLLEGRDSADPFFLQVKEASRSVLEGHLPDSLYANHAERVVVGQRLMQAASDSFLGWTRAETSGRDYYWRQFKDMKASPDVEEKNPEGLLRFAHLCGWTLARAHARSGDSRAIAGYLGSGEVFDHALGEFAVAYADQNERDYTAFKDAIDTGRIQAHE